MSVRVAKARTRRAAVTVAKTFDPDQPRDPIGRWTASGGRALMHGTDDKIEGQMKPSTRGALGPGVYMTQQPANARRYGKTVRVLGITGDVNSRLFSAERGGLTDAVKARITAHLTPAELAKLNALSSWVGNDGHAFHLSLAKATGSFERARDVLQAAGYAGIEGHVDGHEVVIFDPAHVTILKRLR